MDIATARVEPHEIAKGEDFMFGFESLIKNTAILDRMLMSANIDYIAGGTVNAVPGTMTFTVDALWANGKLVELPAYNNEVSSPVAVNAPLLFPRYDTVQVCGMLEAYDPQNRAFYDPELQVAQYHTINTKNRLIVKIEVKQGNEGVTHAPNADMGYIKIAEIYVDPETVSLTEDNIKNITAACQGEENTAWTSEKERTFLIGSMSVVWEAFVREHFPDGRHREAVIKASNILRGIAGDALKSSSISVGENVNSGDLSLLATKTILEALSTIGEILQGGSANTLLKRLSMLIAWKNNETYQPFYPTFYQGRIYYANPANLPMTGESPGSFPDKWINAAGDVVFLPPSDGRLYGMRNRVWSELSVGGLAIEALKFYSKKTIMFTNARIVDRRLRGWDLGLPYLSANHEVYHFDTDTNNQNQQSNIIIDYEGDPPVLLGSEDSIDDISFEPAVYDLVPYEMMGKSLFGAFSVAGMIAAQDSTLEMWMRLFVAENSTPLRLGTQAQDLVTLHIGGADPEYSLPKGDIHYSIPDVIDHLIYSVAKTSGNTIFHDWGSGTETIDLDAAGVILVQGVWLHVSIGLTSDAIFFFIGDKQFSFQRMRPVIDPLPFIINEDYALFNLDELSLIAGAAQTFQAFLENTENRAPYAALDYTQKYAVIMVDDPQKLRTNIFESNQFREAVQAIINET